MTARILIIASLMLTATGCNQVLIGRWKLESTNPPDAMAKTAIQNVTFNPDAKTYSATIKTGDKSRMVAGDYRFDGFSVTLGQKEGRERKYGATYNSFSKKLQMNHTADGKKTSAVYGKMEAPKR